MKLYYNPGSPPGYQCAAAVHHLGLDVELEVVDFQSGQHKAPDYLAINPNGTVPTLVDGDFSLWESAAILQYLGSKAAPTPFWPADERARADISRWQFWAQAHWGPAVRPWLWENVLKGMFGAGDPDEGVLVSALPNFHRFAKVLDDHLAGRNWIVGDAPTAADFSCTVYLIYSVPGKMPLENYPNIRGWFARVEALPGWKAVKGG